MTGGGADHKVLDLVSAGASGSCSEKGLHSASLRLKQAAGA